MTIAAILGRKGQEVIRLAPDMTVAHAVGLLAERRIGCLPVVAEGAVVGILSERDIVRVLGAEGGGVLEAPVSRVMTGPVVTIAPDMPVMTALSLMTQRRIRHLPVLDQGTMVGFVSIGDLVKYRIDAIEAEAEAMRAYIQTR